ncbi:hypothetical protein EVG20_g1288 [Dentipellis fragilis]|uniref:Uncharacterized protein n=1 Tax=Dentipellis fragilis TaxID=205917 RepID=A0A4Y9ZD05_9AGAM|nr:hypothetical protein EVG20_g1288 [Dentipellis fragilis]
MSFHRHFPPLDLSPEPTPPLWVRISQLPCAPHSSPSHTPLKHCACPFFPFVPAGPVNHGSVPLSFLLDHVPHPRFARPTEPAHFHHFGPLVSASAPSPRTEPVHNAIRSLVPVGCKIDAIVPQHAENESDTDTEAAIAVLQDEYQRIAELESQETVILASDPSPTEPSSSKSMFACTDVLVTNSGGDRSPLTARPLREDECNVECSRIEALERMDVGHGKDEVDEEEQRFVEELINIFSTDPAIPPTTRHALHTAIHVSPLALEPLSGPAAPYGTYLSTVILVRRDGRVIFVERDICKLDGKGSEGWARG